METSEVAEETHQRRNEFFRTLTQLRKDKASYDVKIFVGEHTFYAHRIILITGSSYFREILNECSPGNVTCSFSKVSPTTMGRCIDYIYTKQAKFAPLKELDMFECKDIIDANRRLKLDGLGKLFIHHLCNNIDHDSFFLAMRVNHLLKDNYFSTYLRLYFITNRVIISNKIHLGELIFCLSIMGDWREDLEHLKYHAVVDWVKARKEARMKFLGDLLKKIDFSCIHKNFISDVVQRDKFVTCVPIYFDFLTSYGRSLYASKFEIRKQKNSNLVTCDCFTTMLYQFDTEDKVWYKIVFVPMLPYRHLDVTSYDDEIYCVNGRELWRYVRLSWNRIYPESETYCWNDACFSRVIGCGRFVAMVRSYSVVIFSLWTRKCEVLHNGLAKDGHPCNGGGFCLASSDEKIYVIGGLRTPFAFTEIDVSRKRFTRLSPMKQKREHGTACYLQGAIFVFGGGTDTISWFSIKNNQWHTLQDKIKLRFNCKVYLHEELFYFISDEGEDQQVVLNPGGTRIRCLNVFEII